MTQTLYDIDDIAQLKGTFTDITGTIPTDPSTVTCYVRTPDGNVQEFTYASSAVQKLSTGIYYYNFEITQSGIHYYRFNGTGACVAGKEQSFTVQPSKIISG
jgi:hypothetical protein